MDRDYYEVIGVSRKASEDEIRKAYLKLAREHHPDMNLEDPSAKERFQEIQKAYEVLKDKEKRAQYDQFGPNFAAAGGPGAGFEQWRTGGGPGGPGGFSFENIDLSDILGGAFGGSQGGGSPFGEMFGGGPQAPPSRGGRRGRRRQPQPPVSRDVQQELTVPFERAVRGGEIDIIVQRREKRSTLTVKIPVGLEEGQKIRLRGQGEQSDGRSPAGDLILTVHSGPHPCFTRHGKNLELLASITLEEALFGAKIDIPTPNGTVALTIPPSTSGGKKFRIPGHGVPSKDGTAGDLIVQVRILLPAKPPAEDDMELSLREAVRRIGENTTPPRMDLKF